MTSPKTIEELDKNFAAPQTADGLHWYDIRSLPLEGLGWLTDARKLPFDRLPARAKGKVRDNLWALSEHSAGIHVRFVSNAPEIAAKWKLRNANLAMPHMPSTGMSGLDLYVRDHGRWHWAGLGRPSAIENSTTLVKIHPPADGGIDGTGSREYILYLPLYNGVESVQLGFPTGTTFRPAPAWLGQPNAKPIVFWGTSITQGGCAARAGMAYPAIIGRRLESPTINLGFSGNGPLELDFGQFVAELDPAVYVLDNLPNMQTDGVTKMTEPVVQMLRAAHPSTPIVLVENIIYQTTLSDTPTPASLSKNNELRAAFGRLLAAGVQNIHLVSSEYLLGLDGEGTVDGSHPTDLGFFRMADLLTPVLRPLI